MATLARAASTALFVATCAFAAEPVPDESLRSFYAWVLAHPSRALPSAAERAQLARWLSPCVIALLKAASETESKCIRAAAKGDKPLIVEGDLFVGNYEGASEIAYGTPRRTGDSFVVESDLVYVDKRFPKAHPHRAVAWKDRVEMRIDAGRWSIEDIRFAQDRSLVSTLQAYVDEGARSCRR